MMPAHATLPLAEVVRRLASSPRGHNYTKPSRKLGGPPPRCRRCGETKPLRASDERPCLAVRR